MMRPGDDREAMFKQGIPLTVFEVDDIDAETKRLKKPSIYTASADSKPGGIELVRR